MSKKVIIAGIILLIISVFLVTKNIRAQVHVSNGAYDVMLSTLLTHNVPEISVEACAVDSGFTFIDARESGEFKVSHIRNAVWSGYDDFNIHRLDSLAKEEKIVVYCSVGYRSEKITEKLIAAGFKNVSNLYGGIFEWVNTGHVVVDMENNPTQKVHAYSKKWSVWLTKGEKVYE